MLPESGRALPHIHVALFDFDGTLADTIALILSSHRHATQTVLGRSFSDSELMANIGRPLIEQMKVFAPDRAEELLVAYREHNDLHHDDAIREYPGVTDAVRAAKEAGFVLGVVSSKKSTSVRRGMEALGQAGLFEVVVGVEDTERHKPDPEPILFALERLGAEPDEAAYVGDSPFDLAAGRAAGVKTVAVLWGPFSAEVLEAEAPDRTVATAEELMEVFGRGTDRVNGRVPDLCDVGAGCEKRSGKGC